MSPNFLAAMGSIPTTAKQTTTPKTASKSLIRRRRNRSALTTGASVTHGAEALAFKSLVIQKPDRVAAFAEGDPSRGGRAGRYVRCDQCFRAGFAQRAEDLLLRFRIAPPKGCF